MIKHVMFERCYGNYGRPPAHKGQWMFQFFLWAWGSTGWFSSAKQIKWAKPPVGQNAAPSYLIDPRKRNTMPDVPVTILKRTHFW